MGLWEVIDKDLCKKIKITLMDRQVNLNLRNLFPLHNITLTHIFQAVKQINNSITK